MIPQPFIEHLFRVALMLTQTAIRGRRVVRKIDILKLGEFVVRIQRRGTLGTDGGLSQILRIMRGKTTEEVWQIVTKAGKIIHEHLKYRR